MGREQVVPSEFCRWVPCLSFNLVCRVILLVSSANFFRTIGSLAFYSVEFISSNDGKLEDTTAGLHEQDVSPLPLSVSRLLRR